MGCLPSRISASSAAVRLSATLPSMPAFLKALTQTSPSPARSIWYDSSSTLQVRGSTDAASGRILYFWIRMQVSRC